MAQRQQSTPNRMHAASLQATSDLEGPTEITVVPEIAQRQTIAARHYLSSTLQPHPYHPTINRQMHQLRLRADLQFVLYQGLVVGQGLGADA